MDKETCQLCGGKGKVECDCTATGNSCPTCDGSGKHPCPSCQGTVEKDYDRDH